jgi:hypothetical protein
MRCAQRGSNHQPYAGLLPLDLRPFFEFLSSAPAWHVAGATLKDTSNNDAFSHNGAPNVLPRHPNHPRCPSHDCTDVLILLTTLIVKSTPAYYIRRAYSGRTSCTARRRCSARYSGHVSVPSPASRARAIHVCIALQPSEAVARLNLLHAVISELSDRPELIAVDLSLLSFALTRTCTMS